MLQNIMIERSMHAYTENCSIVVLTYPLMLQSSIFGAPYIFALRSSLVPVLITCSVHKQIESRSRPKLPSVLFQTFSSPNQNDWRVIYSFFSPILHLGKCWKCMDIGWEWDYSYIAKKCRTTQLMELVYRSLTFKFFSVAGLKLLYTGKWKSVMVHNVTAIAEICEHVPLCTPFA